MSASRDSNISVVSISFFFALFAVDRYLMMWFIIQFKQSTNKRFAFLRLFQFIIQLYLSHSLSQHTTLLSQQSAALNRSFCGVHKSMAREFINIDICKYEQRKIIHQQKCILINHIWQHHVLFFDGVVLQNSKGFRWIITILPLFFMMFPSCNFFSFETAQISNIPTRKVFI